MLQLSELHALEARMTALKARLEALKWANVQDSNGMAYTPDHFFAVESELLEVAAAFASASAAPAVSPAADPQRNEGGA